MVGYVAAAHNELSLFAWCVLCGAIVAIIAHRKERHWFVWFAYGLFLSIIALVHVLCINRDEEQSARSRGGA
jgi:hypothetical protein